MDNAYLGLALFMVTHLHKLSIASAIQYQLILSFLHMRAVANPDIITLVRM
jgi:hypothetical protein